MGWIYCPNCRNRISSKSTRCYYCGHQIKEDIHQKELKASFNRLFYLHVMGGVIAVIAFIPLLLQSRFRYIWLFVLFIIFLAGYIFVYIFSYKLRIKKQKEALSKWIIKKPSRITMLPEEKYYYMGKINQQLCQYREAWECYKKSLKLNPDFGPAEDAKKEVEQVIFKRNN